MRPSEEVRAEIQKRADEITELSKELEKLTVKEIRDKENKDKENHTQFKQGGIVIVSNSYKGQKGLEGTVTRTTA